ncbi:CpaF family protein [Streptomyces sp. NPDC001205]
MAESGRSNMNGSGSVNGTGARTRLGGLLNGHTAAPAAPAAPVLQAPAVPGASALTSGPSALGSLAALPGILPVPWAEITRLRQKVADDIGQVKREQRQAGNELSLQDQEEVARARILRRVAEWAPEWAKEHVPLGAEDLERIRSEIFNLLFLAGALQKVLDQPGVEDVLIDGPWMYVDYYGQPRQRLRSPFSSRDQAVEWVNQMAAESGHGERQLSYATGSVDFRLPDDSRVAATLLTSEHVIAIRRHVLKSSTLEDLIRWGTVDWPLAAFLSKAVKAGLSMIIAGDMAAGKTTMLRALGREIPQHERIATLESDRELFLDTDETPAHVLAFEAREGNGEIDGAGRLSGQVTLAELVRIALRYKATRVLVGEVRGNEAIAMLQAMLRGGAGSMCTLHAKDPEAVIDSLMIPLVEGGMSDRAAYRLIAGAVDLIVYVDRIDESFLVDPLTQHYGRNHRFVTHVWETAGLAEGGGVALSQLFAPRDEEVRAVRTRTPMDERRLAKMIRSGYQRQWLHDYPDGQWQPLQLIGTAL